MARHYAPKAVMRHLPLTQVREFMAQENLAPTKLCQPAWDALAEGDVPALYRAWCELPPGDRERFEVMMRQVHEMATEAGVRQMLAEADHRNRPVADTLDRIDGLHAKALWVYTYHRIVFHTASQLLAAASPVGRFWNLTTGFGDAPYDASTGALNALRVSVAALYREQGRGHGSTVEHYERDRCLYVFLYLDDYTETHTAHNPAGVLTRAPCARRSRSCTCTPLLFRARTVAAHWTCTPAGTAGGGRPCATGSANTSCTRTPRSTARRIARTSSTGCSTAPSRSPPTRPAVSCRRRSAGCG